MISESRYHDLDCKNGAVKFEDQYWVSDTTPVVKDAVLSLTGADEVDGR